MRLKETRNKEYYFFIYYWKKNIYTLYRGWFFFKYYFM